MNIFRKMETIRSFFNGMKYFQVSNWDLLVVTVHVFKYRLELWHITQLASATDYQRFIINKLNLLPHKINVLDIGCGIGLLARQINYSNYLGIDRDQKVVDCASRIRTKSNINFICGDAENLTLPDTFDANIILALNFLHHFDEDFVVEFTEMLQNKYTNATFIFDFNVSQKRVNIVANRLSNLGFKMNIIPNEGCRGRAIFFLAIDND